MEKTISSEVNEFIRAFVMDSTIIKRLMLLLL